MDRVERIRRWEFWPYWLFYMPIYLVVLVLGFRFRTLSFFTMANPGMEWGGFVDYSKWRIHGYLPPELVPQTVFVPGGTSPDRVHADLQAKGMRFPVVAKPDRGERGLGVEKICDAAGLEAYLRGMPWDTIVQEFVPGRMEYGILYYRFPGTEKFGVTSIVTKDQLCLTGDGRRSLARLIDASERARPHRRSLRSELGSELRRVPSAGEIVTVAEIGNHCRGATFRNGAALATTALVQWFHEISCRIPGFFIGRYDVKANDEAAFRRGEFTIIEVNGVNSEPAHIYDPGNSIWLAYRDLVRHWFLVARIARANQRRGVRPDSVWRLIAAIRRHAGMRRTFS